MCVQCHILVGLLPAKCESAWQGDDHGYPAASAADVMDSRLSTAAAAQYPARLIASGLRQWLLSPLILLLACRAPEPIQGWQDLMGQHCWR